MITNPFTFGSMINDPNKFVGRRAELELIIARLNGHQPQGSSIVGPRRIGKSSLLHYLTHPREDESLRPHNTLCVVYLSAAAGNCSTPDKFRFAVSLLLISKLLFMVKEGFYKYKNYNMDWFLYEIDLIEEKKMRIESYSWASAREVLERLPFHPVICLDEFEALLLNDAFDDRFFNALRNWANEGLVSWVTASSKPLQELLEHNNFTSPFFNLLATVRLRGLTDREADDLLRLADTTHHAFSEKEKRMVKRFAGTNPYHLQIVAWRLWEMKKAGQSVEEKALRDYLCQQPYPPAACTRRSDVHQRYLLSLLLIMLLTAILSWLVTGSNQLVSVWQKLGQFGEGFNGLVVVLTIFLVLIFSRAWTSIQGSDMVRDLWNRLL
ncbi:MAG: hypothetical protein ACPGWR_25175 [Ardenticatenaceae bacterium]